MLDFIACASFLTGSAYFGLSRKRFSGIFIWYIGIQSKDDEGISAKQARTSKSLSAK